MSRLTTRSVKTSVDVDFKTFAYYRATVSFGSGLMTTWLPMSYHEELPVIQTSNSLWNYWNEEESKFPDVYFTACKSGYILADTGYLSHAEYEYKTKIPCEVSDCRTEFLFEDVHRNDPIMSYIFCATNWQPRTFYRKDPMQHPQSHNHIASEADQIFSLETIGLESTAHIIPTVTRPGTPPLQSLAAISPTQTPTITTTILYLQTPPPLPIIRATPTPTTTVTSIRTLAPSPPPTPEYQYNSHLPRPL
ncbi:hypothetical protein GRF29_216g381636 [Pseudopithomyces chartarum]|uniref:Uncharacterized protein n=1 Tax=Pseudopithomyces chartarum TaxID=1892770 RepID=A0AAN6LLG1_9PLEO|nr:hypothetical protein GRF29_216g381636 [Pseudopithomyces chartarum]